MRTGIVASTLLVAPWGSALSLSAGVFYCLSGWVRIEDATRPPAIRLAQPDADGAEVVAGDIHQREYPTDDRSGTHDWRYIAKALLVMWRTANVRLAHARISSSYDGK